MDLKVTDLANDLGKNFPGALKGITDNVAHRVDALEAIIKRYALEANASAALIKTQADRIASLDTAVADRMAAIDARLQGALALVDAAVKAVGATEANVNARPALRSEDEQKLKGYFEHIDKELGKIKAAMADPIHKQKILDESKRMVQDMALGVKVEYGNMLSMAVAVLATQHDKLGERIGAIETAYISTTETPLMSKSGHPAPMRRPPGYSSSSQTQPPAASASHAAPRINLTAAYAAGCDQEDCADEQCNGDGGERGGRGKASPHDGNALCNHCHHVQRQLEKSPVGNPQCHCQHVETLMRDVRSFTTRVNQHEGSLDTLLKRAPSRYDGSGADLGAGGYGGPGGAGPRRTWRRWRL